MTTMKNVLLRSTGRDLAQYREAVYRAIEGLDGYNCVRMEDFGARDWEADNFCLSRAWEQQAVRSNQGGGLDE